jgi:hypothetical protein
MIPHVGINDRAEASSSVAVQQVRLMRVSRRLQHGAGDALMAEGGSPSASWSPSRFVGGNGSKAALQAPLFGGSFAGGRSSVKETGLTGLPLYGVQGPATAPRTEHLLKVLSAKFPTPYGPVGIIAGWTVPEYRIFLNFSFQA